MRLDGYIRVSRVSGREGASFISPTLQREKIEAYCRMHDHQLVQVWEELDESGARRDRPKWQAMLERVEAGETDGVIVSKLDRFSRDVVSGLVAIERIEKAGGAFVVVEEQIDSSTPMGRMMLQVLLAFSEWFRSQTVAGWKETHRSVIARGVHVATPAVGYRRRDDGVLEPDPDVAPFVEQAFRMRAEGDSAGAIAVMLNAAGVKTSRGNRFTAGTVMKVLRSPVYVGEARAPGFVKPDAHEAIVDRGMHALANASKGRRGPNRGRHMLTGLVRCAGCRYTMAASTGRWPAWQCRGTHPAGPCTAQAAASVRLLDEYIEQFFLDALAADGDVIRMSADHDGGHAREAFERADRELVAWQGIETELTAIGEDAYLAGLDARIRRRNEALEELAAVTHKPAQVFPPVTVREMWSEFGMPERRELLRSAIDAVVLRRGRGIPISDRVLVLWVGHDVPLPRQGDRVSDVRPLDFDLVGA